MSILDIFIIAAVAVLFGLALWKTLRSFRKGKCAGCSSSDCDKCGCCDKCKEKSK